LLVCLRFRALRVRPHKGFRRPRAGGEALIVSSDLIERALRRFLTLGQAMRRDAETLPVSVAQSAVLSRLRGGPKTVGELATAEGVRAPSMTQIINRMEEAGWVTRSEGPVRGRTVQITDAGQAVAVAVRKERTARLARRFDGLSAEDLAALEGVLPVLDRIFGDPAELPRRPAGEGIAWRPIVLA
jgi:DNA-binding MarR family transcriptional regulator